MSCGAGIPGRRPVDRLHGLAALLALTVPTALTELFALLELSACSYTREQPICGLVLTPRTELFDPLLLIELLEGFALMKTLAVANQKGGVGKSTTTYHLARAATRSLLRVLLVDADPQGNLTAVTTRDVDHDQAGLADALSARTDVKLRDVIVPGMWSGLDVVPTPSGQTLGGVRDELVVTGAGRERRLAEALASVAGDYDLCLIDCPPSLDQLTMNALTAADAVAIITHTRLWSFDGLAQLLRTISDVRDYYNPALTIAGVVENQHEERTIAGRHWDQELRNSTEALGIPLLTPAIPRRVAIADAVEASVGLDEWGSEVADLTTLYERHLATLLGAQK